MAFIKSKHLEAAQKYLSQGKLQQAIAEYEQILKSEPKDQITLMTLGDLYVRAGEIARALERFEFLAQLFLSDGFNSKAIAIYKKIAKLAPDDPRPLEKLAELYVAQGVMSEARSLYLQMAEAHLRANRKDKAVEVLRQLLDLEPDNLRVQVRLAELYVNIGQTEEAAHAYLNCAHRMFDRAEFSEALKYADQALKASPSNHHAIMVKARASAAQGDVDTAIRLLENLPAAVEGTDVTQLLIGFYVQTRQVEKGVELARKVFAANPERYPLLYDLAIQLLDGGDADLALNVLGEIRQAMLAASDYERLSQALASAAERLPGRLEPLEWLVDCYRRSSDSFRLPQALDQLAEAATAAGQLERARELFEELLEKDADNEDVRRRLNQVRVRLGLEPLERVAPTPAPTPAPATITAAAPATPSTAVPAATAAPPAEGELSEEAHRFVTQALTDVDLFSSYGLTQKAIDLLEKALQRAPRHPTVLEKLLDLYLGAGNDRRTAELAAQLEQVWRARGDDARADRFAELQRRFERAARLTAEAAAPAPPPPPAPEFAIEPPPAAEAPAIVEEPAAAPAEEASAVHEVDLSEEWATLSQLATEPAEAPPAPSAEAAPPSEEIPAEAVPAEAPAEAGEEIVLSLEEEVPVAEIVEDAVEAVEAVEEAAEESAVESAEAEAVVLPLEPAAEAPPAEAVSVSEAPPPAEEPVAPAPAAEAAPPPAEEEVEYVLEPQPEPAAAAPMSSAEFMSDLAAEVEAIDLGAPQPATAQPPPAAPRKPAPAAKAEESVEQLKEVFDEFRSELGQMEEEETGDLETHYNLGIAYREMGLLEEAIGEFQKVAKAIQAGQPFRYAMQCCTLLGLSFMEKGQYKVAAMWYQKALSTEGLDPESILALRYDLGVAQEAANDIEAALESFTQVYAMNIDYRDVAERIAALQKRR